MKTSRCVILMLTVMFAMGCGIKRRNPSNVKYFLLDVKRPQSQAAVKTDLCLRIRPCRMAASFAGRSLIYRTGDVLYEQDYYNLFLTNPENQITDILHAWFREAGFPECSVDNAAGMKSYALEIRIDTLCADFSSHETPAAIIRMYASVTGYDEGGGPSRVLEKTYTVQTLLPQKPTAAEVVKGLSDSLMQILQELEAELDQAL